MADLKKCDGCGKISPNEKGLYIANGWYNVYVTKQEIASIFIFCDECMGQGTTIAKSVLSMLKKYLWK